VALGQLGEGTAGVLEFLGNPHTWEPSIPL
jgi:hypothetical protein